MSRGLHVPSGQTRRSLRSASSGVGTSVDARSFRLILKQALSKLRALDLLPDQTLLWLFRSMTPGQRQVAIGRLQKLNDHVGNLLVRCFRIQKYLSCSKMDSTISHSFLEPRVSRFEEHYTIQCCYTTPCNPNPSKALDSSAPSTPTMDPGKLNERELTRLKEMNDE